MIDNDEIRCSHSHGARRKDIEIGKLQSSDAVLESPTVTVATLCRTQSGESGSQLSPMPHHSLVPSGRKP